MPTKKKITKSNIGIIAGVVITVLASIGVLIWYSKKSSLDQSPESSPESSDIEVLGNTDSINKDLEDEEISTTAHPELVSNIAQSEVLSESITSQQTIAPTIQQTTLSITNGAVANVSYMGSIFKIITFNANGTFSCNKDFTYRYFLVGGGGGGGGNDGGGGGGGGGVLTNQATASTTPDYQYGYAGVLYNIIIGAGGTQGQPGGNTSITYSDSSTTYTLVQTSGGKNGNAPSGTMGGSGGSSGNGNGGGSNGNVSCSSSSGYCKTGGGGGGAGGSGGSGSKNTTNTTLTPGYGGAGYQHIITQAYYGGGAAGTCGRWNCSGCFNYYSCQGASNGTGTGSNNTGGGGGGTNGGYSGIALLQIVTPIDVWQ